MSNSEKVQKGGKDNGLQRGEQKKRNPSDRGRLKEKYFTAERHNRKNDAKSRPYTKTSAGGTRGSWDVKTVYTSTKT